MGQLLVAILVGGLFFFCILYHVICGAVENGVVNALIRYEELKNSKNKSEGNNQ